MDRPGESEADAGEAGAEPTRQVRRSLTSIPPPAPSPSVVAGPAPESVRVTLSGEALENEERGRVRVTVRVLAGVALLAFALTPVMGGDPLARRVFLVGLVGGLVTMGLLLHNAKDGARYNIHFVGAGSVGLSLVSSCAVYYIGCFSPAAMVGSLGLYIFCLGGSLGWSVALWLTMAGSHLALALGISLGIIFDRGLVRADDLPLGAQLAVQACVQGVYAIAFVAGRASRTKLEGVVEGVERAAREVAQRDALLNEAKRELQRTNWVGGEGRFTEQVVGSFRLGNLIGRGGMGEVYEAVQLVTNDEAAVKLLSRASFADPDARTRFAREARAAAAIASPHVVRVIEIPDDDAPIPYLAMERLRGEDLSSMLRRERRLPPRELEKLARHVGRALDAAHASGVVHRDIKPQNLFLTRRDDASSQWKVLDFGVSKLVGQGSLTHAQLVGTPEYMAPEQAAGGELDHRADLYALTAVLYRCVVSRAPFVDESLAALVHRAVHDMPPRPNRFARVSADLEAFLALGLAKSPAARFASGKELSDAFAQALANDLDPSLRERAAQLLAKTPWQE